MKKAQIMPKFVVDMKKIEPSKISEKKIFDAPKKQKPKEPKKTHKVKQGGSS